MDHAVEATRSRLLLSARNYADAYQEFSHQSTAAFVDREAKIVGQWESQLLGYAIDYAKAKAAQ